MKLAQGGRARPDAGEVYELRISGALVGTFTFADGSAVGTANAGLIVGLGVEMTLTRIAP